MAVCQRIQPPTREWKTRQRPPECQGYQIQLVVSGQHEHHAGPPLWVVHHFSPHGVSVKADALLGESGQVLGQISVSVHLFVQLFQHRLLLRPALQVLLF